MTPISPDKIVSLVEKSLPMNLFLLQQILPVLMPPGKTKELERTLPARYFPLATHTSENESTKARAIDDR